MSGSITNLANYISLIPTFGWFQHAGNMLLHDDMVTIYNKRPVSCNLKYLWNINDHQLTVIM